MGSPIPVPPISALRRWLALAALLIAVGAVIALAGTGARATGSAALPPATAEAPVAEPKGVSALSFVLAHEPVAAAAAIDDDRPSLRLVSLRVELREVGPHAQLP